METLTERTSATSDRARVPFDDAALRAVVADLPGGSQVPRGSLSEYIGYYAFDFGLEHEMFVLDDAGERLVVQVFTPGNVHGRVMLHHGYYDHVGIYGYLIEYLTGRGLQVVTYDQIGHGLSTGAPAAISSFDRYVQAGLAVYQWAQTALSVPDTEVWHWVGQSMGGAITMELLHQNPQFKVGEVVLFAPLVRPYGWWYARWVFALAKKTTDERPRGVTRNANNAEFLALQQIDPLQPRVLPVVWVQAMVDWFKRFEAYPVSDLAPRIVQGDADKTVDAGHNMKVLRERYPESEWCILSGAGHHLVNESQDLRDEMFAWLDDRCNWKD